MKFLQLCRNVFVCGQIKSGSTVQKDYHEVELNIHVMLRTLEKYECIELKKGEQFSYSDPDRSVLSGLESRGSHPDHQQQ